MTDKGALLEAYAKAAYDRGFFNGTYLYAEGGRVVASGAYGVRDEGGVLPLDMDTVFELASVSKQFTASAVMLLRKRGLLSLDDDITRFFPAIPYKGRTIRHILNHTAGLPDYEEWVCEYAAKTGAIPANDVILRFLCECGKPELFAPGEKWCYSNTGYSLLAYLVETVSGTRFADFMKRELFEPAGMASTQIYHRRKNGATIRNYAYGMELDGEKYALPDDMPQFGYVIALDGIEGDGVVNANAGDLLLWDAALRGGKILSLEEQELMYAPGALNDGTRHTYGFGWEISRDERLGRIVRHGGGWPGYSTSFVRLLDKNAVFVLLTNKLGFDNTAKRMFFEGMTDIAMGREPKAVKTLDELAVRSPDRAAWEKLCGTYAGGYTFLVREGKPCLRAVVREETTVEVELFEIGKNAFAAREIALEFYFDGERARVDGKEYEMIAPAGAKA